MSALRKILVVDDDPVVGKSFNRVLSDKGYLVTTAANAQEALARLHDGKYDVVYTDIRMPGMDGLELAEEVKARHPWTPVVIVTGYGTRAQETRAMAAGVSAFLHKPLSPEMIEVSAEHAFLDTTPAIVAPAEVEVVAVEEPAAPEETSVAKRIGLLLAAPFIGLAWIVAFPFIGLGFLAVLAFKALATLPVAKAPLTFVKNVGLFVAAPFIGLAYVVMLPFVGAAMLAWTGVKALKKAREA